MVEFADPLVTSIELRGVEHKSRPLDLASPDDIDLVVILVRSDAWDLEPLLAAGCLVFDAVNLLGPPPNPNVQRL